MASSVNVHKKLADLLCYGDESAKLLLGFSWSGVINVVACAVLPELNVPDVTIQQIQCLVPGGIDLVGIAACENNCMKYDAYWEHIGGTNVFLNLLKEDGKLSLNEASIVSPDKTSKTATLKIETDNMLSKCLIARAKCTVPLSFTVETGGKIKFNHLQSEMNKVTEDLISDRTMFHLVSTNVLLSTSDCYGVSGTSLCDALPSIGNEDMITRSKKKNKDLLTCVTFDVYTDLSSTNAPEGFPSCSPIINYSTEAKQLVSINLPIDAVSIFPESSIVSDMAKVMCDSIRRQIIAMEEGIVKYRKGEEFSVAVPYHFQPMELQTIFTAIQPLNMQDKQQESERRRLHQILCLPMDRPLFRQGNKFVFPGEENSSGYLVNVHQHCQKSKVSDGTQYVVQGLYTYHHYMQDRFDDNKWGCAYRSLQTLASWFKLQGYVDRDIPLHKEIQQTLVDIGDKEPNFVGSRKWIGSMEVSFVLDTLLGVTSKIMNVSSGADLSCKGRELAAHFSKQGTPIMIGGGVLAHTILGIDYNEVTGDINFLVLDPHYTGAEELKTIIDKGWCGWKDPNFWDKNAHYNLCMPQRPCVI